MSTTDAIRTAAERLAAGMNDSRKKTIPEPKVLAEYAAQLPAIYRQILKAFQDANPGRLAGEEVAAATIQMHLVNEGHRYLPSEIVEACRQLEAEGFLVETTRAVFLFAPTPVGEALIGTITGKYTPVPRSLRSRGRPGEVAVFWQVHSFPACIRHVFLSHSREDHDDLVRPVYDALTEMGVTAWLDREDYTYGRDSRTALRDGVLRSRHVVFFVTPAMVTTGRGWCAFELAYSEILQANLLHAGGPLLNVFLPLFFLPQADPMLPRTVWQAARDKGRFHDPSIDGSPTEWAVREIQRFLRGEEKLAGDVADLSRSNREFRNLLKSRDGLFNRVTRFQPEPLPQGMAGPPMA